MMKIFPVIILSLLSFSAYAGQKTHADNDVKEISFDGRNISLINDNGHCALARSDDSLLRLGVKWPCWFSQNYQGKALLKNYLSAQIFMVQHSEPAAPPGTSCTTDLQAIRYFKGSVELAPIHRVRTCNTSRWDQKVFVWQFDW
jgi:hypothetical protein